MGVFDWQSGPLATSWEAHDGDTVHYCNTEDEARSYGVPVVKVTTDGNGHMIRTKIG